MKFKELHLQEQLRNAHPRLYVAALAFAAIFEDVTGVEAVVTRVTDPVEGESGVHPAGRAVDFRDETSAGEDLASDDEAVRIVERMNRLLPRADKYVTCLHHKVPGSTRHFHLQLPTRYPV